MNKFTKYDPLACCGSSSGMSRKLTAICKNDSIYMEIGKKRERKYAPKRKKNENLIHDLKSINNIDKYNYIQDISFITRQLTDFDVDEHVKKLKFEYIYVCVCVLLESIIQEFNCDKLAERTIANSSQS